MECHGLSVACAVEQESNGGIVVQVLNPTLHSVQVQQGSRIECLRPFVLLIWRLLNTDMTEIPPLRPPYTN